jgi:processive 1,2-diacylglycerol beta-glucosyltransferase
MKKILIFSSYTGGGHMSLAESVHDLIRDKYEVVIIDPQPRVLHFHYRMVSRYAPWLWNTEYKLSDGNRRAKVVHGLIKPTFAIPIWRIIQRVKPDLILSTYAILTSEVRYAMRISQMQRPFAMLFSDPEAVHHLWLTEKHTHAVFAPTRETYEQALRSGFDPKRLHYTGWPVRRQFYHTGLDTRSEVLTRLGLNKERFTIFLQGGAEGAARFGRTVENLLGVEGVQIILATGTNRHLQRYFEKYDNVHPLPFTRGIARYMAAADIVMGKAGPNMMFEALTLGKPFIATSYIPGQEEVNLEFIERHGLGWIALHKDEQHQLIETLVSSPDKMKEKLVSVEKYRNQNMRATETIPMLIDQLINKKETSGVSVPL